MMEEGPHGQQCCLLDNGNRCPRPAGNASYNKRIQKLVQQRRLKLAIDHAVQHIYICDSHKHLIQNVRPKRKRQNSDMDESADNDIDYPEIDFYAMPVNTLRRFKRHYKLQARPGITKAQLADLVSKHFKQINVVEKEVLTFFIYMAKNFKSRLDKNHPDASV